MAVEEDPTWLQNHHHHQLHHHDRVVLVNMTTQAMVILQDHPAIFEAALFGEQDDDMVTILPAPAASIQSVKTVVPAPEDECSVCLDGFEDDRTAKEMPCSHRFHVGCIERWLGMHGSCPLCRCRLPGTEVRKLRGANGVWMAISLGHREITDRQRHRGDGSSA